MKSLYSKIFQRAHVWIVSCCMLASCNYLDVIPPAQADFDDTMKDKNATEGFLYSCYTGTYRVTPFDQNVLEWATDEVVSPQEWELFYLNMVYGTMSESTTFGGNTADFDIWSESYNHIGYVHRFLDLIDKLSPRGVTEEDIKQYKAECQFLDAYYHFRVLESYGPCPIITELVDQNISNTEIPGRSHFDYCVNYIVGKLDEAAKVLPATRENTSELGRATSVIAKCLKARVLLYAASPLWNGSFPHKNWVNTNYETPEYGKELVSSTYDPQKWERALTASEEALAAALTAGYGLFDIETADIKALQDRVGLPDVPGKDPEIPEDELFLRRVRMFQYLSTAHEGFGNNEIIWGLHINGDNAANSKRNNASLPLAITKSNSSDIFIGGWGGLAPTLYTVQHFYTENGKLPAKDPEYYPESDWYKRYDESKTTAAYTESLDNDKKYAPDDIIKLNVGREARFYAWIAFDGSQYGQLMNNGGPLYLNMKNSHTNGYNSANPRNYSPTGYLSKKFIAPNLTVLSSGNWNADLIRRPFIRMAELYLNLAECYAALDNQDKALENLNVIRERAGLDDVEAKDLNDMSLMEWIRNERFVELFEEGHRYYDIRRWCIAPQLMEAGSIYGLNAKVENPTFEEFNTPTRVDQPYRWDNKLYLLPIWSRDGYDELYSNPQMVQAPGY